MKNKNKNKTTITALVNNLVACTSGRGNWNSGGRHGPDDTNTSTRILLDWMTLQGNYARYRGKDNNGVRKMHYYTVLTEKMTS